ncbi:MAG: LysR family transcriptional regulator [Halioglobus sp.]
MKSLDDMRLFAKVVELGSFTAAAENIEISRALLSRRISALEQRLGVRLLNRTTRRMDLTESGNTYFQYCREIINTELEAEEAIQTIKTEPTGLLRIAMPILFGQDVFAPLLAEFHGHYPNIQLRLDLIDQPADLVASGYDMIIHWGTNRPDSAYIAKNISTMRLVTCASLSYLDAFGTPSHPRDLHSHNCLIYSPLREGEEIWRFDDKGQVLEFPVTGDIEANHAAVLIRAATDGLGLLYAPAFSVEALLARGELVEILSDYETTATIWAEYPHRMITKKERVFLDFLCEKCPILVSGNTISIKS